MHIHIPSLSDASDEKGNRFKVFNIYLNGIYHSSLRYSQLFDLHNEAKAKYDMTAVVDFPPKILRISDSELLTRQRKLERYIHCLCQDRSIGVSDFFLDYMLTAQKVSSGIVATPVELKLFLSNGKSTTVTCSSHDRTSHVLQATCKAIGIETEFNCYFGIFVEYSEDPDNGQWSILRVCCDLESPYLSLQRANGDSIYKFRLCIRKWYFDPSYTTKLIESSTCLNMLYIEILSQLESDRLNIDEDVKLKLTSLKKSGKRKEFIELFNEQSCSGYVECPNISIGENNTPGLVKISGKHVVLSLPQTYGVYHEKIYPISKLRCWKVGILRTTKEHFFAFEFEHQKSKFMWITLRGVSTILFTTCINTAVEEYVLKGNKQQLTMPIRTKNPSVSLPTTRITSEPPSGEDIHMSKPSVTEVQDTSSTQDKTESLSGESSEASLELPSEPTSTNTKQLSSRDHQKELCPPIKGHASYGKKKKERSKKEDVLINPSFVCDDDL